MFIGHVGVALALKKSQPKLNVGWLCLASLWMDILIWTFVLLGIEQAIIPPNYSQLHFLQFVFPYSHSFVAAIIWLGLAFAVGWMMNRGNRPLVTGLVLAIAVASHWVLDWMVHPPEMPVAGSSSPHVGLGLWNNLPVALTIEGMITAFGLWIYYRATASKTRLGTYGPILLVGLVGLLTLFGQAIAPTPPSITPVAIQGLAAIVMITLLLAWFDTKRSPR